MRTYLITYAKDQPYTCELSLAQLQAPVAFIVAPTFDYAKALWESNPFYDKDCMYKYTHIPCAEASVTVLI